MHSPGAEELIAHAGFVKNLARALLRDEHAAEDVAQETFVAALTNRHPVRGAVRGWLAGVTKNLARMRVRSEARRTTREHLSARADRVPSAAETTARMEVLSRLVAAVRELSEPYRSTILMRYFDQMSPKEISRRTGTPVKTVKTRLHRGLGMLRKRMDDSHDGRRLAWGLVLLPSKPGPAKTSIVPGVALMITMKKVMVAGAVVLAGAAVYLGIRSLPAGSQPPPPAGDPLPVTDLPDEPGVEVVAQTAKYDPRRARVTVEGLVLSAATGLPISGARILAHLTDADFEATTDANGEWVQSLYSRTWFIGSGGYPGGQNYRLTVKADGYATFTCWFLPRPGDEARRAPTVFLHPADAWLVGKVTDAGGAPVPDADVRVYSRPQSRLSTTVRTDAEGRYGPVPVLAGEVHAAVAAGDRGSSRAKLMVFVNYPPKTHEIDHVLVAPGFVEGMVVDPAGRPLPDARIYRYDNGPRKAVGPDGSFRWPVERARSVRLYAECDGYCSDGQSHKFEPGPGAVLTLEPAASLSGKLLLADESPASRHTLRAQNPEGSCMSWCETTEAGEFRIESLRPGMQQILVYRNQTPLGTLEVEVAGPGPRTGVVLHMPAPLRLTGIVLDAITGAPIPGAGVGGRREDGSEPLTKTDETGRFNLPYVPLETKYNKISVTVHADGYLPAESYFDPRGTGSEIEFKLMPLGAVALRVVDPDGSPLPGAFVTWKIKGWPGLWPSEASSDRRAVIQAELPAAPVQLTVRYTLFGEKALHVTPVPGGVTNLGDVAMFPPITSTLVTVRDPAGAPIPDACLFTKGFGGRLFRADAEGRIRIPSGTKLGHYMTKVTAPGREVLNLRSQDKVTELNLTLRRAAPITGRVLAASGEPLAGVEVNAAPFYTQSNGRGEFRFDGFRKGMAVPVTLHDHEWTWAVAGGETVELRRVATGRLRLLHDGSSEPVGMRLFWLDGSNVDGEVVELYDHELPETQRESGAWLLQVPAGRVEIRFRVGNGGTQVAEVLVQPDKETVFTYVPPKRSRLTIRVLDPRGLPVKQAEFLEIGDRASLPETNEDGRTSKELRFGGPVRFAVRHPDFATLLTPILELGRDQDLEVRLQYGGTVQGTVACPTGPIPGTRLRLLATDRSPEFTCKAREKGAFKIKDPILPGRHTLEIRAPGRLPETRSVTVVAGETTRVEVRLP